MKIRALKPLALAKGCTVIQPQAEKATCADAMPTRDSSLPTMAPVSVSASKEQTFSQICQQNNMYDPTNNAHYTQAQWQPKCQIQHALSTV